VTALAPHRQRALLSKYTSRCNKIALCAGWRVDWRWAGPRFNSRIEVLLDGAWTSTKSYEDDIRPKLKLKLGKANL
jgi:hypothetical protein